MRIRDEEKRERMGEGTRRGRTERKEGGKKEETAEKGRNGQIIISDSG